MDATFGNPGDCRHFRTNASTGVHI